MIYQLGRRAVLAGTAALGVAALTSCDSSGLSASSSIQSRSFASVDEWIEREAIAFSSDGDFDRAVDGMMSSLGDRISLLGFGEALHGGDEFLTLRNRFFQRLVAAHGYSAITLEITDTRARLVNDYISGRGPAKYEEIQDSGFSYGAGLYAANRELVEWMKQYNSNPAHAVKLSFYGTVPTEQGETTESPRRAIELVLAYLQSVDAATAARHAQIIRPLVGADADWEGPAAALQREIMARLLGGANAQAENPAPDASLAFGVAPRAQALRLALENLAFELHMRQPELVAQSDRASFDDALHEVSVARNVLALHAALARREPLDTLVSMRDAMAGEHLVYIAEREQARGKVMVHLHNAHLRRTRTKLPWYEFLPTGAHLDELFGERFAVIGGAVGTSEENFIGAPQAGSLEARLLAQQSDLFLPTWRGRRFPEGALAAPPVRSRSARPYITYEPLTRNGSPSWTASPSFARSPTRAACRRGRADRSSLMKSRDLSRRSFLAGTSAALGVAALTSCASTGRSTPSAKPVGRTGDFVEDGWGWVADTFRANFKEGKDLGAACCVYVDGRVVVDLWDGLADRASKRPWDRDTVVGVASTTKGATAMCAHLLVQRGQLDLDAPVTRYWPEFGAAGKENIPVKYLLSHQVGLPVIDARLTFEEVCAWHPVIRALEVRKPLWTPGTEHLYHPATYGFLVGEVVRRITGKTLGTFFHEEIARPLGLSAWIGLPEEIEPRIAQVERTPFPYSSPEGMVADFAASMGLDPAVAGPLVRTLWGPDSVLSRAGSLNGAFNAQTSGSRAFRAAEFPSGNLFADAHSIARMYAATVSKVDGIRLLQADTVAAMTVLQTDRSRMHGVPPELLPATTNLFKMSLGFWRPSLPVNPLLGPASFGHPGSGGSLGAADPEARVAFGYVANLAPAVLIDTRARGLTDAVRKCLG